ncbi:MAG TPA: penicillin-binding transpeptidase domain-containing protein [Actinomycetota bacterium]
MNRSIRRVALILGLAFLALFVNLNIVQLGKSTELATHPRNRRLLIKEYATLRGEMLVGDRVVAESVESGDETYRFARRYPLGPLYGHITGYYSFFFGAAGLERSYNDELLGREPATTETLVDELLGRETQGNVIELTLDHELQRLARRALSGQRGAVAAIDPQTGAVLALYANPSFDPTPLSKGPVEQQEVQAAWEELNADERRPLLFRATQEAYPPGSTFKIVTAAAGLQFGKMTPSTSLPDPSRLSLPDTNRTLSNFQNGPCTGGGSISMATGFRVSCNTTFAQIAMRVGKQNLARMAERFGLGSAPDVGIATVASCVVRVPGVGCGNPDDLSRPATAYSGIGQQDVRVTPLQMAMVAAAVANGGHRIRPYLVQRVLSPEGVPLIETQPQLSDPIMSQKNVKALRQMMIDTVRFGTGAVVGFQRASSGTIGGKTGTAETGIPGQPPHVWFVAFAPGIAVAAVVENGGDLGDAATGGRVAGPITRALVDEVMSRGDSS